VVQVDPICSVSYLRLGRCVGARVVQVDPYALRLTAPQCERGVTDAYDEGIATGPRLGEDLHLLTMHEAELEQPPLESRQGVDARADADD